MDCIAFKKKHQEIGKYGLGRSWVRHQEGFLKSDAALKLLENSTWAKVFGTRYEISLSNKNINFIYYKRLKTGSKLKFTFLFSHYP